MFQSLLSFFSPPVIILTGAIVVAFCSAMNITNKWLRYCALAGTIIVALGTFWQAQEQNNSNTGGDSFAYFIPQTHMYTTSSEPPSYNDVELHLMHSGKYPLYDIQIRLVDLQQANQIMAEHRKSPLPYEKLITSGEINDRIERLDPGRMMSVFKLNLPANAKRWDYNVFFDARNMKWVQALRFIREKEDETWRLASRTRRGAKVLQEQGSSVLPKDDSGKPKWD
jgi:hypothetical protein